MLNIIFTVALLSFPNAGAETFLTYDEITLNVLDEPSSRTVVTVYRDERYRTVERPMRTVYRMQAVQGSKRLDLSEAEFERLSILFKNRRRWLSAGELDEDLLRLFGTREPNWPRTVQLLNDRIRAAFGRAMILGRDGEFKLAEPPGRLNSDSGVTYEIHPSGKGVAYRGVFVTMTAKQIEVLRVLESAPDQTLSFPDLRLALGNSPGSMRPKDHIDDINKECLRLTGASLIRFARNTGFSLRPVPRPDFPLLPQAREVTLPAVQTSTPIPGLDLSERRFELTLGPMQGAVFATLKLGERTPGEPLELSQADFEAVGLPVLDLRKILGSINREYIKAVGMPVLTNVHLDFNMREPYWSWKEHGFESDWFDSSKRGCGSGL